MVKVDEVFNLNNNKICRLHGLPGVARQGHSICGHLLCGGHDTRQSCLMLNTLTGEFTPHLSHTEREETWSLVLGIGMLRERMAPAPAAPPY